MFLISLIQPKDTDRMVPKAAYLLVLFIAAAVAVALGYAAFLGNLPARLVPVIEAADQIKIEVALARLEAGTTTQAGPDANALDISSHYDRAENLVEFLLADTSVVIPRADGPAFRDVLQRTREQIKRSRTTTARWIRARRHAPPDAGREIDPEFGKLISLSDEIHVQARTLVGGTISDFRRVQSSLIVASILLAFLAGAVLYRFDRRRAADYNMIQNRNQQLQASDQQLRASNQQLRATEQQLRASNQQLHATDQQLRASNQQLQANEQALRLSEGRYRSLFSNMSEGMALYSMVCDEDGKPVNYRIVDVNRHFEEMFRLPKEKAVGRLAAEVFGTDNALHVADVVRAGETGEVIRFESYFPHLDSHFLISVYSPERGICAAVFRDITGKKKAAAAMRRDALRLETLMQVANYRAADVKNLIHFALEKAVSLLDGRIGYIYHYDNKAQTFKLCSSAGDSAVPQDEAASALVASGLLADAVQQSQPLVLNELPARLQEGDGRAQGLGHLHRLLLVPVVGRGGAVAVACVAGKETNFDEHDGRELALLMDSVWKIVDLQSEREERVRLETRVQKLESVGVLAGGIAHDFNNLLTVILTNVTFAKMQAQQGEPVGKRLEEIERASDRAQGLTQQLLTFAKGGKPIMKLASLEPIIRDSAGLAVSGSKAQCRFRIAEDLCSAEVDAGQIGQVINNLVINAVQAMPTGGTVMVHAENAYVDPAAALPVDAGHYVKVTVSDRGIGIPHEHLDRIFDPYFTTKQKGSGLGLAISHSVVMGHRGYIAVDSRMGEGTAFHVYLPASCQSVPQSPALQKPGTGSSGRVLVMDDEEMLLRVCYEVLKRIGYEVETVQDGRAAIERYAQRLKEGKAFDVVILDLTIPGGMGGRETIEQILKIDPHAKALVSSGYSNDPVMSDYASYGFRGLIPKPYTVKSLSEAVNAVLRSGRKDHHA